MQKQGDTSRNKQKQAETSRIEEASINRQKQAETGTISRHAETIWGMYDG
jgi:hypothetical protein